MSEKNCIGQIIEIIARLVVYTFNVPHTCTKLEFYSFCNFLWEYLTLITKCSLIFYSQDQSSGVSNITLSFKSNLNTYPHTKTASYIKEQNQTFIVTTNEKPLSITVIL